MRGIPAIKVLDEGVSFPEGGQRVAKKFRQTGAELHRIRGPGTTHDY